MIAKKALPAIGRDEEQKWNGEREDMKVKPSVKPICEHCSIIKRHGVVRVICSKNPRHKQSQGPRRP